MRVFFGFLGALRGETIQSTACLQGVLQGDLWNPKLLSILLEEIIRYSQQVVLPSQKQTPETKKLNRGGLQTRSSETSPGGIPIAA